MNSTYEHQHLLTCCPRNHYSKNQINRINQEVKSHNVGLSGNSINLNVTRIIMQTLKSIGQFKHAKVDRWTDGPLLIIEKRNYQ